MTWQFKASCAVCAALLDGSGRASQPTPSPFQQTLESPDNRRDEIIGIQDLNPHPP